MIFSHWIWLRLHKAWWFIEAARINCDILAKMFGQKSTKKSQNIGYLLISSFLCLSLAFFSLKLLFPNVTKLPWWQLEQLHIWCVLLLLTAKGKKGEQPITEHAWLQFKYVLFWRGSRKSALITVFHFTCVASVSLISHWWTAYWRASIFFLLVQIDFRQPIQSYYSHKIQ